MNREDYKRAFSSLHTTNDFKVNLEDEIMLNKKATSKKALVAASLAAVVILGGTSAYAANVGGIQKVVKIWFHGEKTEAVLKTNEKKGTYSVYDKNGKEIQGGGGVAIGKDGKERPLDSKDFEEEVANDSEVETIDGHTYIMWRDQKVDITDDLKKKEVVHKKLKSGDEVMYFSVKKNGNMAASSDGYIEP
jgi:hypothetical protein